MVYLALILEIANMLLLIENSIINRVFRKS